MIKLIVELKFRFDAPLIITRRYKLDVDEEISLSHAYDNMLGDAKELIKKEFSGEIHMESARVVCIEDDSTNVQKLTDYKFNIGK